MSASLEGDPGKLAYLHNPNWRPKLFSGGRLQVDPRVCPGCLFPGSAPPTPHVSDDRCQHVKTAKAAAEIEAGRYNE